MLAPQPAPPSGPPRSPHAIPLPTSTPPPDATRPYFPRPSPQGFPNADAFDPDRMGPQRKEDIHHAKNFLTFGYGPHYCVGACGRGAGAHGPGGAASRRRGPSCHRLSPLPGPATHPTLHSPPLHPSPPLFPGKEYAINQLVLFLAIVSLECDWDRQRTPDSGGGRAGQRRCPLSAGGPGRPGPGREAVALRAH